MPDTESEVSVLDPSSTHLTFAPLSNSQSEVSVGEEHELIGRPAEFQDLVKLMQKQTDLTERLVANAEERESKATWSNGA